MPASFKWLPLDCFPSVGIVSAPLFSVPQATFWLRWAAVFCADQGMPGFACRRISEGCPRSGGAGRVALRWTESFTGCAALHAGRGGPQNGPRHMLQVRTASASIASSTERVPLPSDPNAPLSPSNAPIRPNAPRYHPLPPGKAQSTSWYQQLTHT